LVDEIKIRGYIPGDEKKIIELLSLVFNGWPPYDIDCSQLDHWNWKFNNEMSKKTMAIAEDNNQIVGTFLIWSYNLKISDSIYNTSNGVDVAVHPNYRRFGLFNKTRDFAGDLRIKNNLKIHLGMSYNPIIIQKYDRNSKENPKLWPKFPFIVNHLIKIKNLNEYLKKNPVEDGFIKKAGYNALSSASKLESMLFIKPRLKSKFKLRQISLFDSSINDFWDSIKDSYDFILERKKEFLNWRYFGSGAGHYRVIQAEENGQVFGYSVLRINRIKPDNPNGFIVDLLATPGKLDIVDALIEEAVRYFEDLGINTIYSMVFKNHPYSRIYRKYGFVTYTKGKLYLWLTEDLGKTIEKLQKSKVERAHIALGDEDEI
jgi:GNAT superfamily N-acetyltransferase